jgi:hypothetical protein
MLGRTSPALGFGGETFDFVEGFHLSAAVQSGVQRGGKSSLVPLTQGAGTGNFWKVRAFGVEQREQLPFRGGWASFPAVSPNGNRVYMGWTCSTPTSAGFGFRPGEAVGPWLGLLPLQDLIWLHDTLLTANGLPLNPCAVEFTASGMRRGQCTS